MTPTRSVPRADQLALNVYIRSLVRSRLIKQASQDNTFIVGIDGNAELGCDCCCDTVVDLTSRYISKKPCLGSFASSGAFNLEAVRRRVLCVRGLEQIGLYHSGSWLNSAGGTVSQTPTLQPAIAGSDQLITLGTVNAPVNGAGFICCDLVQNARLNTAMIN
jgi:hypothetical protein